MKKIEIEEFMMSEVGLETTSDIICGVCGYRAVIRWIKQFPIYRNPNYNLIVKKTVASNKYLKWIEISPQAITCLLETLPVIICPRCNENHIKLDSDSKYNPHLILESLECHKLNS